ncbi:MAG: hypothetical protein OIF35_06705 [Cellvibrionaceae bacterium]|nr:hypothetical protein [Cellvibrionaceae bacterium]
MLKRTLLLAPLLLVLLLVCVLALRYGLADIGVYSVRYQLNDWHKQRQLPDPSGLRGAMAKVDRALALDPRNPEYLEMKAYLYWLRILAVAPEAQAPLRQVADWSAAAAALHRQAIDLRPRWPASWSGLALMKAYQQQWDQEFEQALAKAAELGPWEPAVQIQLALVAQLSWAQLGPDSRQLLVANFERGVRRNAGIIRRNLEAGGMRATVCFSLPRGGQAFAKLCQGTSE